MSRSAPALAFVVVAGLWLSGCGGEGADGAAADATDPLHGGRPRVAYVSNGVDAFWVIAQAGAEAAAAAVDCDVSVHMPAEGLSDQKRILEDLLVQQVDGIAVSPIDPVNQTGFLNDLAARTTLITHDSDAPDSARLCFIGVDNYEAGRLCGTLIAEALPDGGEVFLFVGRIESDNARRRRQGILDVLLERASDPERTDADVSLSGPRFTVLGTLTDQFDRAKGKANVEDVLSRHPDVDALVGLFAYNTPLILEALAGAGRLGEVEVIGFDEADETLTGIANGQVHATVVQDPYMYGYRAVEILAALARGDRSVLPEDGFDHIPARAIGADEVAAFRAQLDERLGLDG